MIEEYFESIFRKYESKLDARLNASIESIFALDIRFKDASNRKRSNVGRGLDRLWWGCHFEKFWDDGDKSYFSSVRISYSEPSWFVKQPQVIYKSVYWGEGDQYHLASKVASNAIEYQKGTGIEINSALNTRLDSLVIDTIYNTARIMGTSL